jgi:O-antigen ligase
VWRQKPGEVAATLLPLLAAAAALAALWRGATGEARTQWASYLLLFAAACAGGLLVWRSMAFAGALAAVPLGWLVCQLLESLRAWRERVTKRTAGVALAALVLALAGATPLLTPAATAQRSASGATPSVRKSSCELRRHAPSLDRMAPATIFAPLDIGPR